MKNLNKVLAMLVVFMMMVSTVAFAAEFTDVAEDSSYYTAIKVGTDLGLFVGYEDGSFAPEGEITRAEFAAIVVRMAGQEGQVAGAATTTPFTDVPDWAKGYVNIAAQKGIINGYGDGRFGSDDQVEYQDAITMIVRALGYEPAIGSAGYPTGYLTKAGELGLTANVNGTNGVAINRGAVAQIVFNALDVALMTQSGYGTFTQYVVNDGYSATNGQTNVKKTIMSENHDVYKLQGLVMSSTDSTSVSTTNTPKVKVEIQNALANKYSYANGVNQKLAKGRQVTMEVAESDALDFVGKKCMLFVEYDEFADEVTVKSIYPAVVSDSLVIDIKDLKSIPTAVQNVNDLWEGDFEYYSSDDKVSTVSANKIVYNGNVASTDAPDVFVNGVEWSQVNNVNDFNTVANLKTLSGTIEFALLDTANTSADFDTVYIEAANVFVVDEVKTSTSTIKNKLTNLTVNSTRNIKFDESDGDVKAKLIGLDGAAMDWADLKELDVLMVKYIKANNKDIYSAQMISNKVEGTINSISGTVGQDDRSVDIDGVSYDVAYSAENGSSTQLKLADTGVFYLDENDNIIYFDATSRLSGNYAYVLQYGEPTGMSSAYQLKLLTKDNDIIVYDVAKTFKYDEITGVKIDTTNAENVPGVANATTLGINKFKALQDKIITYAVNSANQIVTIDTAADATDPNVDPEMEFTYTVPNQSMTINNVTKPSLTNYDPSDKSFGAYNLKDETVIFAIDANDKAESEVVAIPVLEEDDYFFDVELFDVDEDDYVGCIVVKGTTSISANTDYATFVTKVSSSYDENGNDVIIVTGFKGLEEITYTCEMNVNKPAVGTIVVPKYALDGTVESFITAGEVKAGLAGNERKLVTYDLVSIDGNTLTMTDPNNNNASVVEKVKTSANVYVYDATSSAKTKYKIDESLSYIDYDSSYAINGNNGLFRDDDDFIYNNSNVFQGSDLDVKVSIYYTDYDEEVDVVYYIY